MMPRTPRLVDLDDLAQRILPALKEPWAFVPYQKGWSLQGWQSKAVAAALRGLQQRLDIIEEHPALDPEQIVEEVTVTPTAQVERQGRIEVGGLSLDLDSHLVTLHGQAVILTRTEIRVLALLMRNAGQVISAPQILTQVWTDRQVSDNVVPLYISYLRKKTGVVIETRRGLGYLLPPMQELSAVG